MATIKFYCPHCTVCLEVEESQAPARQQCVHCGAPLSLLGREEEAPCVQLVPLSASEPAEQATAGVAETEPPTQGRCRQPGRLTGWQPGEVILGLYEVKQVYQGGGMGLVYQVRHRGWGIDLAVKHPRLECCRTERDKKLFEREAETWVQLGLHPHIVSCYYVRRLQDIPCIFAEYMDGGSLVEAIRSGELYAGDPEQRLARLLDVAIQMAWGLHYAHEQGLVHQDVKPGNVLLTRKGVAKVTDFGLARTRVVPDRETAAAMPDATGDTRALVTLAGMTLAYRSPEQAQRQSVSAKTDIWSWGVSVLEMFLGEVIWRDGQVAAEALKVYLEGGMPQARVPSMPRPVVALLERVFQRQPAARPTDMQDIANILQAIYQQVLGRDHPRAAPRPAAVLAASLNNRAVSLLDLGKAEEAEKLWQEALAVEPHHPESSYNLGLLHWRSHRLTEAALIQQLREVCASRAGDWLPLYLLAQVHLEREEGEPDALAVLDEIAPPEVCREEVQAVRRKAEQRLERTGRPVWVLGGTGHSAAVASIGLSRDGQYLLAGTWEGTLHLWEIASGRCLHTLAAHPGGVTAVCLSPEGQAALSGGGDQTLKLWEIPRGRCLRTYEGHADQVTAVCFSPRGRYALSGSFDSTLRLW
ncbi:MAG: protein kinase, partial [Gemmataceae bacterium]|nr:protein kinase [Gemmataceae bacterium]